MKKAIIILSFIFVSQANAQENIIKMNPLSLIISSYSGAYERVIGEKTSAQLSAFYMNWELAGIRIGGFGITPEFRYYFLNKAPNSMYISPFARFQNFEIDTYLKDPDTASVQGTKTHIYGKSRLIGGGFICGFQLLIAEKISIDFYLGPSYYLGKAIAESNSNDKDFDFKHKGAVNGGFGARFGFMIGYIF